MSSYYNTFASRSVFFQTALFLPMLLFYILPFLAEPGLLILGLFFQLILALAQILLSVWHVSKYRSAFHKKHLKYTLFYGLGIVVAFFILAAIGNDTLAIIAGILGFCIIPIIAAALFIYQSHNLIKDPNFPPAPQYTSSNDLLDDFHIQ
jgi:hypothetical protein